MVDEPFRVGDRVRCTEASWPLVAGRDYYVCEVYRHGPRWDMVAVSSKADMSTTCGHIYWQGRFSLVERAS